VAEAAPPAAQCTDGKCAVPPTASGVVVVSAAPAARGFRVLRVPRVLADRLGLSFMERSGPIRNRLMGRRLAFCR
jgi:hypothetical protein